MIFVVETPHVPPLEPCFGGHVPQERPFLITADDVNEVCRAYFMMRNKDSQALEAFEALSEGEGFSQEAIDRVKAGEMSN